jgi:hypothetical protein
MVPLTKFLMNASWKNGENVYFVVIFFEMWSLFSKIIWAIKSLTFHLLVVFICVVSELSMMMKFNLVFVVGDLYRMFQEACVFKGCMQSDDVPNSTEQLSI